MNRKVFLTLCSWEVFWAFNFYWHDCMRLYFLTLLFSCHPENYQVKINVKLKNCIYWRQNFTCLLCTVKILMEIAFSGLKPFFIFRDHVKELNPNEIFSFSFSRVFFPASIMMCKAENTSLADFLMSYAWQYSFFFGNGKCKVMLRIKLQNS